jgi:hypothetical protein
MANLNEKGQSTIEFILTFTASVGFIFLFLKLALNYTNGYMVHHATYMASRSYLVNDEERDDPAQAERAAETKAKAVFTKYLPPDLVKGVEASMLKFNVLGANTDFMAFVGVWVEYTQAFTLGFVGGKEPVVFRSESFLGREPTRQETLVQVCEAIRTIVPGKSCDKHVTLDDNGG